MIKVYDRNLDRDANPIPWEPESGGSWERALIYPTYVELIAGSEHTVVSLTNIDCLTWEEGDSVKVM